MNKRAIIGAAVLIGSALAVKANDTPYTLKVIVVNKVAGHVEAKFIVAPEDLRLICDGDVTGIQDTDYVKVKFKDGDFYIGKAKCGQVRWYK